MRAREGAGADRIVRDPVGPGPVGPAPAVVVDAGSGLAARLRSALREVAWFVNGVLGANAYEHYRAHHYATGCDHAPMSEREFWRAKMDDEDRNPSARCC